MQTIIAHADRAPHALVQVGQHQITVELPGGIRVGDPTWTHQVAKNIAAGLEDAYRTWPPQAAV